MSHKAAHSPDSLMSSLPDLVVPLIEEPDVVELKRRQELAERARKLRQKMREESGPLAISTSDLKHGTRNIGDVDGNAIADAHLAS